MRKIRLLRDLHAKLALRDCLDALRVLELRDLHIEPFILLLDASDLALRLDERVAALMPLPIVTSIASSAVTMKSTWK